MKKVFVAGVLFVLLTFICGGAVFVVADIGDISKIRRTVMAKASLLRMSTDAVTNSFAVLDVSTNGTLLAIAAKDVCGIGTNGVFFYPLDNTTNLIRVVCRDDKDTGADYWYYPNGTLRYYSEYCAGSMHGIDVKFHTNSNVSIFMNISNSYFVGKCYMFGADGCVTQVITASTPQPMWPVVNPPDKDDSQQ